MVMESTAKINNVFVISKERVIDKKLHKIYLPMHILLMNNWKRLKRHHYVL